jgi:DNA (cytosine-5)-methyltransferase 1
VSASPSLSQVRRPAVPLHRGKPIRLDRNAKAPDPADLDSVHRWLSRRRGRTAVDLFAGAGGLSYGLARAGINVLVGADSDPWAVETHTANVGGLGYCGDLSDPTEFLEHLDGWGIETVDVVVGGVPCQPFSRAGHSKIRDLVRTGARSADDPRVSLWRSFMEIVRRLEPKVVLVENVPDLPRWDDGAVLIDLLESLRAEDYEVDAQIIDCFAFGVPQHRSRLFIAAHSPDLRFDWPAPTGQFTSLRDAIGDLPIVPAGQREERLAYRPRRPHNQFQARMRAGVAPEDQAVVHDHITRSVRSDDLEAYEHLREGQTYADVPQHLRRYRSDIFTDKYKRLAWHELSRTITAHLAKDGYWYIHPEQHRTLSIREAARIQTFPDEFRFAGQATHRYRQIGNAVPPIVGEALGGELVRCLRRRRRKAAASSGGPRELLTVWHVRNVRSFPWRLSSLSPWHVLMAEMCLHRTRADQVAPVFERLLEIAPTPQAMVDHAHDALDAMQSLGLRWRAENLVQVAEVLIELFDGEVPNTDFELRMLPGVGDYVSQAVLCFGFGRRAVLIDTNTVRIISRLHGRDATRRWQLRLDMHRLAGAEGADAAFNYALLDLGALVCRAGIPRCGECPLKSRCVTGSGAPAPEQLTLAATVSDA